MGIGRPLRLRCRRRPSAGYGGGLGREDWYSASWWVGMSLRPEVVAPLRRCGEFSDVVCGRAMRRGRFAPQQLAFGEEPPLGTLPAVARYADEVGPARLGRCAGVGPGRQGYNRACSSEPSLSLSYALRTEEKGAAGRSGCACGRNGRRRAFPFRTLLLGFNLYSRESII